MDAGEALVLLAEWANTDRREVNADVAKSYARALPRVTFDQAMRAADYARQRGEYIDAAAILRYHRAAKDDIAHEVRAAKAAGILPESFPKDAELPGAARARLERWREHENRENNDRPEELAPATMKPAIEARIMQALPTLKTVDEA